MSSTVSSGRRDTWEKQNPCCCGAYISVGETRNIEYVREKKV